MQRIDMKEVIAYMDDPCFVNAADDYMLTTSKTCRDMENDVRDMGNKLYHLLPKEKQKLHEDTNGLFADFSDCLNTDMYGQGLMLASMMFLGKSKPDAINTDTFCNLMELQKKTGSVLAVKRIKTNYNEMIMVLPKRKVDICNYYHTFMNLCLAHGYYTFLFALEFGIYIYKYVATDYKEDTKYIDAIYRLTIDAIATLDSTDMLGLENLK